MFWTSGGKSFHSVSLVAKLRAVSYILMSEPARSLARTRCFVQIYVRAIGPSLCRFFSLAYLIFGLYSSLRIITVLQRMKNRVWTITMTETDPNVRILRVCDGCSLTAVSLIADLSFELAFKAKYPYWPMQKWITARDRCWLEIQTWLFVEIAENLLNRIDAMSQMKQLKVKQRVSIVLHRIQRCGNFRWESRLFKFDF